MPKTEQPKGKVKLVLSEKGRAENRRKRRARLIDDLRAGAILDNEHLAAIADSINDMFERLAAQWSTKYFSSAGVELLRRGLDPEDQYVVSLVFRRRDSGWAFMIDEEHVLDTEGETMNSKPISSAPLEWRVRAVDLLPRLEDRLKEQRDAMRQELLHSYDKLAGYLGPEKE